MAGTKTRAYVDIMALHPEVTGSCIICVVKFKTGEKIKFAVDVGLFQEEEYGDLNSFLPFKAEDLDFILVTHNHIDHIGRLPLTVKKGFCKKIYMTNTTKRFMKPALDDSYNILSKFARRSNGKQIYNSQDIEKTMSLVVGCNYNETINVHPNIKVTFFVNGHLLGASMILVQIETPYKEEINLLFTGDYNNKNIFFDVPDLPNWVLDLPLTVIQEATYGAMESKEIHPCFEENILTAVQHEKNILIPVFSLGRAQEILYYLKKFQCEGKLKVEIPIYLDGPLAQKYTNIYQNEDIGIKEEMKDFLPRNFKYISRTDRMDIVEDYAKSKIVLTSSGMGSYGPAQIHIPSVLSHRNGFVHFTGYMAEGTLGRQLYDSEIGDLVSVKGLLTKKLGDVKYTNEFSGHAKADEMIDFLKKFRNLKVLLINHGETKTKDLFGNRTLEEINVKNIGILGNDYLFRIDPYGLVKTMTTKFC